ncbi:hypothetical protein EBZ80_08785 [bacterium]|nr:hypothetical protein [bacterium]
MKTKSGSWEIINTTRYNTDDLVAVFNAYEDWMKARWNLVQPDRNREEGVVRIGDYSPQTTHYRRTRWTVGGLIEEVTHCYVRGPMTTTRHMRDIGLIKPTKLYDNPVEALSAPRVDGQEVVPVEFIKQLVVDAILRCYSPSPQHSDVFETFDFSAVNVRIMKNRADKTPVGGSRAAKLLSLQNAHDPAKWAARSMLVAFESWRTANLGVDKRFAALGLPRSATEAAADEFAVHLNEFLEHVRADSDLIAKERE